MHKLNITFYCFSYKNKRLAGGAVKKIENNKRGRKHSTLVCTSRSLSLYFILVWLLLHVRFYGLRFYQILCSWGRVVCVLLFAAVGVKENNTNHNLIAWHFQELIKKWEGSSSEFVFIVNVRLRPSPVSCVWDYLKLRSPRWQPA